MITTDERARRKAYLKYLRAQTEVARKQYDAASVDLGRALRGLEQALGQPPQSDNWTTDLTPMEAVLADPVSGPVLRKALAEYRLAYFAEDLAGEAYRRSLPAIDRITRGDPVPDEWQPEATLKETCSEP